MGTHLQTMGWLQLLLLLTQPLNTTGVKCYLLNTDIFPAKKQYRVTFFHKHSLPFSYPLTVQ